MFCLGIGPQIIFAINLPGSFLYLWAVQTLRYFISWPPFIDIILGFTASLVLLWLIGFLIEKVVSFRAKAQNGRKNTARAESH